jgi:hypothetical protein
MGQLMTPIKIAALGMLMTATVGAGSAGCEKQGAGGPAPSGVANSPTTIVVEDHTGDEWPVHEALDTWAQVIKAAHAALVVEYGRCREGARCVHVDASDQGAWNSVVGRTSDNWDGADITLNTHYSTSARQRRAIACHELGHALGLGHNPSHDSCLYASIDDTPATTPDQADQDALARRWPAQATR